MGFIAEYFKRNWDIIIGMFLIIVVDIIVFNSRDYLMFLVYWFIFIGLVILAVWVVSIVRFITKLKFSITRILFIIVSLVFILWVWYLFYGLH